MRKFHWNSSSRSEDMNILVFHISYFHQFFEFFWHYLVANKLTKSTSSKLHATYSKNMLTCQRALCAYVLTCQCVLRAYVLTCQCALRAYVLTCQGALRACVLTCQHALRAYVLKCQHALRANLQLALCAHVQEVSSGLFFIISSFFFCIIADTSNALGIPKV